MNVKLKDMTICMMNYNELCEFMQVFKLNNKKSSIINPSVITYNNGDIYKGEICKTKNRFRNGYGEIIYANGDVFATKWNKDIAHGNGVYVYANGTYVYGNWNNGILNGKKNNIIKFTNCDVYKGQMYNNMIYGNGTYTYANGELYIGEFINGLKCGYGISYYPNNYTYMGYWFNDTFNGYGILYTYNKIYSGVWCDGVQQEDGTIQSII